MSDEPVKNKSTKVLPTDGCDRTILRLMHKLAEFPHNFIDDYLRITKFGAEGILTLRGIYSPHEVSSFRNPSNAEEFDLRRVCEYMRDRVQTLRHELCVLAGFDRNDADSLRDGMKRIRYVGSSTEPAPAAEKPVFLVAVPLVPVKTSGNESLGPGGLLIIDLQRYSSSKIPKGMYGVQLYFAFDKE